MEVQGTNIFTAKSIANKTFKLYPHVAEALKKIEQLMKECNITKVER